METRYCTIVARNYLPRAIALYQSLRRQSPGASLSVLLIDGSPPATVTSLPALDFVLPDQLSTAPMAFNELAAIYNVVELSTALKPRLLQHLLQQHQSVAYLDPDMFLLGPLEELQHLAPLHQLILTPHFLHPIAPGSADISEIHSLTVGCYNLGFIAVSRGADAFLQWWWSHLATECLIYPLLGLFVDQKWVDIGATLFPAYSLRHAGYNVGPWNLHERPLEKNGEGEFLAAAEPLRLFHFSGFDLNRTRELSSRLSHSTARLLERDKVLQELCRDYASRLKSSNVLVGESGSYRFDLDTEGRRMTTRIRRAYRADLLRLGSGNLPSPYLKADARAYSSWRRASLSHQLKLSIADVTLASKYAFPDEFATIRRLFPNRASRLRRALLNTGNVRR